MENNRELIESYLDKILPNVGCELIYHKDYEFLIAVMLSAQTTDKAVNNVTAILFDKYKNLQDLAKADIVDIENIIAHLGMYKVKARNVLDIANGLLDSFCGIVPSNKEDLMSLPGVGNKTAEVVRIELFKLQEFPVDTHVARISKRLNIAKQDDDVIRVENKLKKYFIGSDYIKLHHQFIHFGRYLCKAKNPQCENCELVAICNKK